MRASAAHCSSASGESLTPHEKAELNRRQEETFLGVFLACKRTLFSDLMGASSKVLCDNRDRRGLPWPEGKREPVDGRKLLRFLWRYFLENKTTAALGGARRSTEEILLEGASPELKDEYVREQIREKQLNRELTELELFRQVESHLPTEKCRLAMSAGAQLIAKKREHLERVLTGDALEQVSRAFEDLADDLEKCALAIHDGSDLDEFDRLVAG